MKVGTQQMNKHVGGAGIASQGVDIHIYIQDENDNNPVFVPSKKLTNFANQSNHSIPLSLPR